MYLRGCVMGVWGCMMGVWGCVRGHIFEEVCEWVCEWSYVKGHKCEGV